MYNEKKLYNIPAEQALLGALLLGSGWYYKVEDILTPDHFSQPIHQRIYKAIQEGAAINKYVDATTLKNQFDDDYDLKQLGGAKYLIRLTNVVPNVSNLVGYAKTIIDLAKRRIIEDAVYDLTEQLYDMEKDTTNIVANVTSTLMSFDDKQFKGDSFSDVGDVTDDILSRIEAVLKGDVAEDIIPSGLSSLDELIDGYKNSEFTILAGRPSMGKTAFAVDQIARCAEYLKAKGQTVLVFSLEMSKQQFTNRLLARESGIYSNKLRNYKVSDQEYITLHRAKKRIPNNIMIVDGGGQNIDVLCATARTMQRKYNVGMIWIDHIGFIRTQVKEVGTAKMKDVSGKLQALTLNLNIPLVALSQLNRGVEGREDKRPQLQDLRESGDLEQDANNVLFIYREEYYHERQKPEIGCNQYSNKIMEWEEKQRIIHKKASIIVGKMREAQVGTVHLNFDYTVSKFSDIQR